MPYFNASRNDQDAVCPYETNPFLRPARRGALSTANSEILTSMSYDGGPNPFPRHLISSAYPTSESSEDSGSEYLEYYDEPRTINTFDILQANIATPLAGPYNTLRIPDARTLWSKNLIEQGKLEEADAALLALIVDCAMKVYITADLDLPCLEHVSDDDLVWTVIYDAYWAVVKARSSHAAGSNSAIHAVDRFLLSVVGDLPKLQERCKISFRQHIQDAELKSVCAFVLGAHDSFNDAQHMISKVYRWVYGEWPWVAIERKDWGASEDLGRRLISIRQWVFERN
jgi:hypothetical protein